MKIILSPAKKMNVDTDSLDIQGMPVFLEKTEKILTWMKSKSYAELKKLWNCNDKIAEQNVDRLKHMDLRKQLIWKGVCPCFRPVDAGWREQGALCG